MEIKSLEDKKMEETGNDSLTTKINDKFHFKMITSELFPKTQKEIEIIASSFSQSYDLYIRIQTNSKFFQNIKQFYLTSKVFFPQ